MLSLVTLSATFPNVYGPAIFQQQQLQRQPQKEGKIYEIKSSRDGCILALNIATSCLIFPWQSSQTLPGGGYGGDMGPSYCNFPHMRES